MYQHHDSQQELKFLSLSLAHTLRISIVVELVDQLRISSKKIKIRRFPQHNLVHQLFLDYLQNMTRKCLDKTDSSQQPNDRCLFSVRVLHLLKTFLGLSQRFYIMRKL